MSTTRTRTTVRSVLAVGAVLLAGACSSSSTSSGSGRGVQVTDAWARSTASLAKEGAVYLTLESAADDALTGVSVDASVARQASMHESMMTDGGMMSMEPLEQVELPAGQQVVFEPGKKHIMLDELAKPLETGATFTLHLTFDTAAAVDATVTVRD